MKTTPWERKLMSSFILSPLLRWFLEYNLVLPDGVISIFDNRDYYDNIEANVDLKKDAGFNTSITDVSFVYRAYMPRRIYSQR